MKPESTNTDSTRGAPGKHVYENKQVYERTSKGTIPSREAGSYGLEAGSAAVPGKCLGTDPTSGVARDR